MNVIKFTVPGTPVPKARPRVTRYGTYTPKRTLDYEKAIREAWKATGALPIPAGIPIYLTVIARFAVPKSESMRRRREMVGRLHTRDSGDLDNIVKAVQDALNKTAYADDCAIACIKATKEWALEESTIVQLTPLEKEALSWG